MNNLNALINNSSYGDSKEREVQLQILNNNYIDSIYKNNEEIEEKFERAKDYQRKLERTCVCLHGDHEHRKRGCRGKMKGNPRVKNGRISMRLKRCYCLKFLALSEVYA